MHPTFTVARPVWLEDLEREKNIAVGFRATVRRTGGPCHLRIAAMWLYRVFVNGQFLGHGPARGPRGHHRVDEWQIDDRLIDGDNVIAIEVAGYNVDSFFFVNQPSFLQAEVTCDGKALAATLADQTASKPDTFSARRLPEVVQNVERYTFQRVFGEVYRVSPASYRWRIDPNAPFISEKLAEQSSVHLIPRRMPHPQFHRRQPARLIASGILQEQDSPQPPSEFEVQASSIWQQFKSIPTASQPRAYQPDERVVLDGPSYHIFDLGTNLSGFPSAHIACEKPSRVMFVFDEILTDGDVDFKRPVCVNLITYELELGEYDLESFQPYTMRYLKLALLEGECEVRDIALREYASDAVWEAQFACSDPQLNQIFDAGRETYRQNSADLFMDCPSRERAGWLCDSFFTARVALDLTGSIAPEKAFLENFLLADSFPGLPDGMLPMCYPSDALQNAFIPNWAMWFVIQMEEYLHRSGDRGLVDGLRPRVLALFDYFKKFLNSDGLLEKLENWVFIEWSKANDFVQDVNYPSNMVYAGALDAASRIYSLPELARQAAHVRERIRQLSFRDRFFTDNAIRQDGVLKPTSNRTEVCQYYAFFFGIATPQSHSELWSILRDDFDPSRGPRTKHLDVHPANAFIGQYLRLELLARYGESRQLLAEMKPVFLPMAQRTGTLWENLTTVASCNHGFASHVVRVLYRDALGIRQIDHVAKSIEVHFTNPALQWCEGRSPGPNGPLALRWRQDQGAIRYHLEVPAGYHVKITSTANLTVRPD